MSDNKKIAMFYLVFPILIMLLILVSVSGCGKDEEPVKVYPPSMPPEVPKEDIPDGPPERIEYGDDGNGNPTYLLTRNLYNATHIEVFYTPPTRIREDRGFVYILEACALFGVVAGHSFDKVGVLNGMFKEQGYTRDFLLNPEVERTWSGDRGFDSSYIASSVNSEFANPLLWETSSCTDIEGNKTTCKQFMCGVDKTPEPVEETGPPETLEIEVDGETVEVGTRNLYDAEEIIEFNTPFMAIDPEPSFKDLLTACVVTANTLGVEDSINSIGLLNGIGKEQGYTKDFLLDPDVTRTWSNNFNATSSSIKKRVDADFDNPLGATKTCSSHGICKVFLCGLIKGD